MNAYKALNYMEQGNLDYRPGRAEAGRVHAAADLERRKAEIRDARSCKRKAPKARDMIRTAHDPAFCFADDDSSRPTCLTTA